MNNFSYLTRRASSVLLTVILIYSAAFVVAAADFALRAPANGSLDASFVGGVTEGKVQVYVSAVQPDGKILVGGGFSFANGTEKNTLTRLNADGTLDATFNQGGAGPNSVVYDIAILADGKILIAGLFGTYNGVVKTGIARLNADGTLDATFNSGGTGVVGTVHSVNVQNDGKILISGNIVAYNGTAKFAVVRLNADGTLDAGFVTPFTNNLFVEDVELQTDGKIVIAGGFTVGSPLRAGVARLNTDGSLDTTFNPNGGGTNNGVFALDIQPDGKILIGGNFTLYNGAPSANVARLNAADGSLDSSFTFSNGPVPIQIEHFAIQPDGKILVAGLFRLSPTVLSGLIRLETNGVRDTSVLASVDALAYHVTLQADNKPLLGGFFNRFASQPRNNLVRFNTDLLPDNTFTPTFVGFGYASALAAQPDGKIIAAGNFNFANAAPRNNVARFNQDGTLDASFTTGAAGTFADTANAGNIVNAVAVQPDGKIIVGGNFGGYNGTARRGVFRLNADGALDAAFSAETYFVPLATAFVNDILVLPDGKILLGGIFITNTNPATAQSVIRLNADGSLDSGFSGFSANSNVNRLIRQPDGKIIVGGAFSLVAGQSRNRITRLNADGTLDNSFNVGTGANGVVQNVALQPDGKIVIGGNFTLYNTVTANRVARLNSDGSLDNSFNAGAGANGSVEGIAIQPDGKIIIGGRFSTYNGTTTNRLARLNADGSHDATFVSGFDGDTRFFVRRVLLQADGKLLVSGLFKVYSLSLRNGLARLLTGIAARPTQFDFDGDGKADVSVFRPDNGAWYLLQSANGFTGAAFGISTDRIVPADFDGDGKTDIAVYRGGTWYLQRSQAGFAGVGFGATDDVPQPGDYDGDGKAELAVFRPSNGGWYVYNLATNQASSFQFGASGDKPVAADYDGDGKFDYAVFRTGTWYIQRSQLGFTGIGFGDASDKPVPADYDGDGKTDVAVFRNGVWYLLQSTAGFTGVTFGVATDLPVAADYDGDDKADVAVFRSGVWYIQQTTAGFTGVNFGAATDRPIPNAYVP
jgi:uncharacterized delta-60 repeat protein